MGSRPRFNGFFKPQRLAFAATGPTGKQPHGTPPARIARTAGNLPVVLAKAAIDVIGNTTVQRTIGAFQQVHQPCRSVCGAAASVGRSLGRRFGHSLGRSVCSGFGHGVAVA